MKRSIRLASRTLPLLHPWAPAPPRRYRLDAAVSVLPAAGTPELSAG